MLDLAAEQDGLLERGVRVIGSKPSLVVLLDPVVLDESLLLVVVVDLELVAVEGLEELLF